MSHILQNKSNSNETCQDEKGPCLPIPRQANISKSLSVTGPVPWKTKVNTAGSTQTHSYTNPHWDLRCEPGERDAGWFQSRATMAAAGAGRGPKVKASGESYRPVQPLT